jgi:DNA-binding NtrC family response regulator
MIKIGLYSEDRTLHPLLSSTLGKEFQVALESDEAGMSLLLSSGACDVLILDLNSSRESFQDRIEFSRRLIATNIPAVVLADDSLRLTAQELVDLGALGYCRKPPSIRDIKTLLGRAFESSSIIKQPVQSLQRPVDQCANAARFSACAPGNQPECLGAGNWRKRHRQGTDSPRHSQSWIPFQPSFCSSIVWRNS